VKQKVEKVRRKWRYPGLAKVWGLRKTDELLRKNSQEKGVIKKKKRRVEGKFMGAKAKKESPAGRGVTTRPGWEKKIWGMGRGKEIRSCGKHPMRRMVNSRDNVGERQKNGITG